MFLFDLIKKIFTLSPVTIGEKISSMIILPLIALFCYFVNPFIFSSIIGTSSVAIGFMIAIYSVEILCITFCCISGILIGYNCIKHGIDPIIELNLQNYAEINQSKISSNDDLQASFIMSELTPKKYNYENSKNSVIEPLNMDNIDNHMNELIR